MEGTGQVLGVSGTKLEGADSPMRKLDRSIADASLSHATAAFPSLPTKPGLISHIHRSAGDGFGLSGIRKLGEEKEKGMRGP